MTASVARLILFAVSLEILAMGPVASSEKFENMEHVREVLLTGDQGGVIWPLAIASDDDGGLVVVGYADARRGWAAKIGADDKTLWTYYVDLRAEDKAAFAGKGAIADYRGAVPMADGTTFLCGYMPRPPGGYVPGLLTHIDKQGHLLSERYIKPRESPARGITRLEGCVRWKKGIAVLGQILDWLPRGDGTYESRRYHWLMLIDESGNVEKETVTPTDLPGGGNTGEFSILPTESGLIFSATDIVNTEVVYVGTNGQVLAKKKIPGAFRLVTPIGAAGTIQIFGHRDEPTWLAITLDNRLEEIRRTQGTQPKNWLVRHSYRLPDQSFVLMGSAVNSPKYSSRIARVDGALKSVQSLELPKGRGPLWDGGSIWAATPTKNAGEFVIARSLVTLPRPGDTPRSGFTQGAVLDFVRFK